MSGIRVRGKLRPAGKTQERPRREDPEPVAEPARSRSAPSQAVSRAARQLALAYYIERLIEAGEVQGYAEAARLLGVTRARVTQLANILLLPPGIQESIVADSKVASERSLRAVIAQQAWPLPPPPRRR